MHSLMFSTKYYKILTCFGLEHLPRSGSMTNIARAKHNRDDFLNRLVFCANVVKVLWVVRIHPPPQLSYNFQKSSRRIHILIFCIFHFSCNLYFRWFRPFCFGRFGGFISTFRLLLRYKYLHFKSLEFTRLCY